MGSKGRPVSGMGGDETRFRALEEGGSLLLVDGSRMRSPGPELFTEEGWRGRGAEVEPLPGRDDAGAWAVEAGRKGESWVLRRHGRRGFLSRFLGDRRPWRGPERSSPFREFRLLARMAEEGLPVPAPVGALVHPEGAFYHGALLTVRVPGRPLAELLRENRPNPRSWGILGRTLQRFHQRGIWHPDLSAGHILVDRNRIWLVDFEGARERKPGGWAIRHLGRIRRAAVEELGRDGWMDPSWQACWQAFLKEYRTGQGKGG